MKTTTKAPAWLSVGLCLSLLAAAVEPVGRGDSAHAAPVRVTGESSEYFLIEWDSASPHPGVGYEGNLNLGEALQSGEVGLLELRCRAVDSGWQLEQDVTFPFEDVRLMAVERIQGANPGLIWREIASGAGRTIFAEWGVDGEQLNVREWSSRGSARRTHQPQGRLHLPLSLIEAARIGDLPENAVDVFDPLQGQPVTWSVTLTPEAGLALPAGQTSEPEAVLQAGSSQGSPRQAESSRARSQRTVEFHRADGSSAGSYRFEGSQLISFGWQHGGLRMTRLSQAEHSERRVLWGIDED